jgi:(p)ppGpp synthase/HD superfamily hydrolase
MQTQALLELAIALAVEAHRGQKDRYGAPYILHPLRVMARMDTDLERTVAVLHDVVEDTELSFADLRARGFGEEVLAPLDCVTRRETESYEQFVQRSASNPVARKVKLADLEDNMDLRRLPQIGEEDLKRLEKYRKAYAELGGPQV